MSSAGGLKYGPVSYAGLSSILAASRSGPRMKEPPPRIQRGGRRGTNRFLHAPGAAPDAIYLTKHSLPLTPVGARKKSTLGLSLVCPHTPVDRRVRGLVGVVLTPATKFVTLAHVRPALPWDRHRTVFADEILLQNDVRTPITSMAGAAERSVVTCCRAVNTPAHYLVMKAYAVLVRSRSMLAAIVAKCRPRCCAVPRRMNLKVEL